MSFFYLNRWQANSGASYAWVGRALTPELGFLAGWALIIASTVFMVAGSFPAGSVTLAILDPKWSNNLLAVTLVGGFFFLLISFVIMMGIRITVKVQWMMSSIELVILIISGIVAVFKFGAHPLHPFNWSWFSISSFPSISTFFAGALVAAFYYWGWDVSANLSEETKNSNRNPGIGPIVGIVFLFAVFELFTVATQVSMTTKMINNASTDILQQMGIMLYGPQWGNIVVLAVILSTIATLETSLLQVTRTLFSMGRDRVIAPSFSKIHAKWQTPYVASIFVTTFALALFVLANFLPSIGAVMSDAINAIGLQVVFYYALAAISVIVFYRKIAFRSVANFIFIFLWPLIAAVFLITVGIFEVPSLNIETNIVGIGLLAIGIVPMLWARMKKRVSFFYESRQHFNPTVQVDAVQVDAIEKIQNS
jgi:amino acid transporter